MTNDPKIKAVAEQTAHYGKSLFVGSHLGSQSFFGADVSEDWESVDIGLIGVPTDIGTTGDSGTRFGPQAIRQKSRRIKHVNPLTGVIPYELARVNDLGDVPLRNHYDPEVVTDEIYQFYKQLHDAQILPVTAGGDHSITYPILKALKSDQPLGLIHIDAHLDTVGRYAGSDFHHGAPFRNAVEAGVIDPKRTIQLGIRDPYEPICYSAEYGMHVLKIDQVYEMGLNAVIENAREVVGDAPTYISFDIDALDPAFAPGTGTLAVGGLTSYEGMKLIQGLRGLSIVGADLVEVSPPLDTSGITALAGAQLMFELLCVAAESFGQRNGGK
jgi:guanidinopropionase